MAYEAPFYALLAESLNRECRNHHLSRPCLLSKRVLSLAISGSKYKRLYLVSDSSFPRVYLREEEDRFPSFSSSFLSVLEKEAHNAFVEKVEQLNGDRALVFSLLVNDEAYRPVKRSLVYEMLPKHPNLILLNEENRVLAATRESPLDSKRPILRGLRYEPPLSTGYKSAAEYEEKDLETYFEECETLHPEIYEERRKERYGSLIEGEKRRIALLERKLLSFGKDEEEAKKHLDDGKAGDAIYMGEGIDWDSGTLVVDGKTYSFDPYRKRSDVAASFYKRAKKAKKALGEIEIHRKEAEKELDERKERLSMFLEGDEALLESYLPEPKKKGKKGKPSPFPLPMAAKCGTTTILFGKNAKENDALTFLFDTSKDHYWLHVQSGSGAHVMVKKENPNEEELLFAAEIALLASGRSDGEVMVARRNDVRKGRVPGEALVSSFKTIYVRKISKEAEEAYKKAKRIER